MGSAILFVAAALAALLGGPLGLVLAGLLIGAFHTGPVIEGPPPPTSLRPAWIYAWLGLPYALQFGLLLPDPAVRERMLVLLYGYRITLTDHVVRLLERTMLTREEWLVATGEASGMIAALAALALLCRASVRRRPIARSERPLRHLGLALAMPVLAAGLALGVGDLERYADSPRGPAARLLLPTTVAVSPLFAFAGTLLCRSALAASRDRP